MVQVLQSSLSIPNRHIAYRDKMACSSIGVLVERFRIICGSKVLCLSHVVDSSRCPKLLLRVFLPYPLRLMPAERPSCKVMKVEIPLSVKNTFEQSFVNLSDDAIFAP